MVCLKEGNDIVHWIMLLLFICCLILNYFSRKSVFDSFVLVIGPYIGIVILNNTIFLNFDFYRVSDLTILIYCVSMLAYYIGSFISHYISNHANFFIDRSNTMIEKKKINYNAIYCYVYFCIIVRILDLAIKFIQHGFTTMFSNDMSLFKTEGISAHLMIGITPLCAILMYHWMNTKKKKYLYLVIFSVLVKFLSFTKYDVISILLVIAIYITLNNKGLVKKIMIPTLFLIVIFFVSNYFVGFVMRGFSVNNSFYLNHMWSYIAGGTLNLENVSTYFGGNKLPLLSWLFMLLSSFPNMFSYKLIGIPISSYVFETVLPAFKIGMTQTSNVISIIGTIYVHTEWLQFILVIFIWGFITEYLYNKAKYSYNEGYRVTISVYIAFCVLSFFGCFFALSAPWEMMIQGYLLLSFFSSRLGNRIATRSIRIKI